MQAARSSLEEGLALREEIGNRAGIAESLLLLGRVALLEGAEAEARSLIAEGTAIYLEFGARAGVASALEAFAELELEAEPASAVRLSSAAAALREELGAPPAPAAQERIDQLLRSAKERLDAESFDRAWASASQADPVDAAAAAVGERSREAAPATDRHQVK